MHFIDLFAGLGGFHLALRNLGHECVFASEIDETLRKLYERNFAMHCEGDLRQVRVSDIPPHDILCAGFPCQPFSKAGSQSGLEDVELGDLYLQILRVIRSHRSKYLILENVPNLKYHNDGRSWERMRSLLVDEGYTVNLERLSPHQYGIPQIRDRIYIVASLDSLDDFKWPKPTSTKNVVLLQSVLLDKPQDSRTIPDSVNRRLRVWQEFLDLLPKSVKIPHPLWSMEFGATYPFELKTPSSTTTDNLRRYRGSYGCKLSEAKDRRGVFRLLPSHARRRGARFPRWKIRFIRKNRDFYELHSDKLSEGAEKIKTFPSSFQKLEWNCQEENPLDEDRRLTRYVIQVRPSGVRVKRPNTAPSLVAMTQTQVPIIMWERRYMTPTECKRLQSLEDLHFLPDKLDDAYAALGNAVNVHVAQLVAEALVGYSHRRANLEHQRIRPGEPLPAIQSPLQFTSLRGME